MLNTDKLIKIARILNWISENHPTKTQINNDLKALGIEVYFQNGEFEQGFRKAIEYFCVGDLLQDLDLSLDDEEDDSEDGHQGGLFDDLLH